MDLAARFLIEHLAILFPNIKYTSLCDPKNE